MANREFSSLQTRQVYDRITENAPTALFALSLFVNLAAVFVRQNFTSVETWENGEIAQNLIQGVGFSSTYLTGTVHPSSVMAPVYSYFLAGVYWLFGVSPESFVFVQVLQALVQSGAVVLLFLVGRRLFDERVALVGGVFMALYPDYVYSVTVVHQLVFTTFLMILLVLMLLRCRERGTVRSALAAGAVLGVTILTFPMALVFSPFVALWLLLQFVDTGWKRSISLVAVVTLTTIAFVAPWAIRNTLVHDRFVLMKLVGWNFWRGNVPPAIHTGVPNTFAQDVPQALEARVESLSEAEADSLFFHRAWQYVVAHPGVFLRKYVETAWYFWWFPPTLDHQAYQAAVLRKIAYAPVFVTGLVGIALERHRWRDFSLVFFLFAAFTLGYAAFFVLPRYKVPTVQPFLLLFSAVTVYEGFRVIRARSRG